MFLGATICAAILLILTSTRLIKNLYFHHQQQPSTIFWPKKKPAKYLTPTTDCHKSPGTLVQSRQPCKTSYLTVQWRVTTSYSGLSINKYFLFDRFWSHERNFRRQWTRKRAQRPLMTRVKKWYHSHETSLIGQQKTREGVGWCTRLFF